MRRILVVATALALLLTGCGSSPTGSDPTSTTLPHSATTTTTTAASTTVAPTTTPTTTTTTTTTTSTAAATGPDYLVTGAGGVYRVAGGAATVVVAGAGVMWAADDGSGGVVYYAEPGVIEHLPSGASEAATIATNASPNFVALVDAIPTLEISQIQQAECDDADSQHAVLVDLSTGEHRLHLPCVPLESGGLHPRSMGGILAVATPGGGWPDEAPVSARLVFRPIDLPVGITALTGWDAAALERLVGLEVEVAANPWPEPCRWCTLDPRLSPHGSRLAVAAFTPTPVDLGAADWDEFDALPLSEQWDRWEEVRASAGVQLSVIDLATGETSYEAEWPGPGRLLDFDGRYLVYRFGGSGHHSQFPYNTHLIDTATGAEIPITWPTSDPATEEHIALLLP